ncbi:hypothetical protein HaLaN_31015, partial [Haematococcus lacustris]
MVIGAAAPQDLVELKAPLHSRNPSGDLAAYNYPNHPGPYNGNGGAAYPGLSPSFVLPPPLHLAMPG